MKMFPTKKAVVRHVFEQLSSRQKDIFYRATLVFVVCSLSILLNCGGRDRSTVSTEQALSASIISQSGKNVTANQGDSVNFQGSASGGTGQYAYQWTFNGGNPSSSSVQNPGNVTFSTVGTYTVDFQVSDSSNQKSSASVVVTVNPPPLNSEEPLVFDWLKYEQDHSSPEKKLLPAMEDNCAETFNNSLAAICFILKGEKERAERILDFYANATNTGATDYPLQNFFHGVEARGFFQTVALTGASPPYLPYHALNFQNDRWIGDMAWLLIAYKYYEKEYNDNVRYSYIMGLIKNLFVSFFQDNGSEGYVKTGWRNLDTSFDSTGNYEGNIDCYAALMLCEETALAAKIKNWLDNQLAGKNNLPLDLYSWRVLTFGSSYGQLLEIPESEVNQYKKETNFNGNTIQGFYSMPTSVNNIWTDGTAQMACAYISLGNNDLGYYYANELDKLIIYRTCGVSKLKSLPYAANTLGDYSWVDPSKGFTSCAAWYIFAKNKFNPMTLNTVPDSGDNNK